LMKSTQGRRTIATDFSLCPPYITDDLTAAMFVSVFSYSIGGMVQYAAPGQISSFCKSFMSSAPDGYHALIKTFFPLNGAQCIKAPDYQAMINELKKPSDDRSWTSQTCHEFGYYQTGDSSSQVFSSVLNLNLSLSICRDVFNISEQQLNSNIDQTNQYYGGHQIDATQIVFSNGELDPWHPAGIYPPAYTGGEDNIVYLIDGGAHCWDLEVPRTTDSPSLQKLRQLQQQAVSQWAAPQ